MNKKEMWLEYKEKWLESEEKWHGGDAGFTISYAESYIKELEEKVLIHEQVLHDIYFASTLAMNPQRVQDIIHNIGAWSWAHRSGNGEYTEEEQQALINKAFRKLTHYGT